MPEQHEKQTLSITESAVGQIWMEALQLDNVNPGDNFFELGGDSLTTMMMLFRVSDVLDMEMPPDALVEAPTLREFCQSIDNGKSARIAAAASGMETGTI
jgi:acyl carrier protein